MKRLSLEQWKTIAINLAENDEVVEISWLDPGDSSEGEWCLHFENELFEDGFKSEKEAQERLNYLHAKLEKGLY